MSDILASGKLDRASPVPKATGAAVVNAAVKPLLDETAQLRRRRWVVAALNIVTMGLLFSAMAGLLAMGGMQSAEVVMLAAYSLTLPWLSIGFWNGVIGFAISLRKRQPAAFVNPYLARAQDDAAITARIAIAMAVRNEDTEAVISRLDAMHRDLVRSGWGSQFAFHILSDSVDPAIIADEERLVAAWQKRAAGILPIHYRRRTDNTGYKAGNIAEFCASNHGRYDFFIPLDADSKMSAAAILRLVRVMQVSPEIGILQGLVVGAPSRTLFTRAFQFGMRHGMRAYTLGSAWWQGDCGPFWGHNALVRMDAFHQHCQLPVLSGTGPFGGHILSHDQVEAVLMRSAGYEVRVLAEEQESFEENPPSLPDFIKREMRWCQGNMQYWRLLAMPGLKPTSRLQLFLAILMYVNAPAWMLFITAGAAMAVFTDQFSKVPLAYGLGLFAVIMAFNLMPKAMGIAESFLRRTAAETYGGRVRVVTGAVAEFVFSTLMAPAVAFAIMVCCLGLVAGKRITWDAQQRSRDYLSMGEAARTLWPQTLFGVLLGCVLAVWAPWALLFGCLIVLPMALAIPIAVLTTVPAWGRWTRRHGLFDIPEDRAAETATVLKEARTQAA